MKGNVEEVTKSAPAPEILRRGLLGLVTALIVARPLVLGEDPGLTEALSDPFGLTLTLLWFTAAAGWAVWRFWFRQGTWYRSGVEAGLLAIALVVWISALGAARYRYPALLISCEWLALLVVFCLVRQLAPSSADNRRLLAALLASGVSLSAYSLYQYAVEMPELRRTIQVEAGDAAELSPTKLRQLLTRAGIPAGSDADLQAWNERIHQQNAFATFAHPNAFAGFLALLFPGAIGAVLVTRRWTWRFLGALTCALLMASALWLTHSRGAVLALLLVGGAVVFLRERQRLWQNKARLVASLAGVAGIALLLYLWGWQKKGGADPLASLRLRGDYWVSTWSMIRDHPWLGVGPGNFQRWYPRYMLPGAWEKISDPHNFALEIWATSGILALVALLATLVVFFREMLPAVLRPGEAETEEPPSKTSWEFHLGGLAGLVLGFGLWAAGQTGDNMADRILLEGVAAGVRAVIWFAAFALLEGIAWPASARILALTAGVAALLLNLLVSGGISYPSVAQPLWFVAALALNALPAQAVPWRTSSRWQTFLPLVLLTGGALAYYLWMFSPAVSSGRVMEEARRNVPGYWLKIRNQEQLPSEERPLVLIDAHHYLQKSILKPLQDAKDLNPLDIWPWVELAHWEEEELGRFFSDQQDPPKLKALSERIKTLDPEGSEGYLLEFRTKMRIAQQAMEDRPAKFAAAARPIAEVVKRDPTDSRLHLQLADLLFQADDPDGGWREARQALALDEIAPAARKLTAGEREPVQKWLRQIPPRTSQPPQ